MRKSIYTFLLTAVAWGYLTISGAQNCPAVAQCPNSLQTICDPSENDSTLWNEDPYTWSPLLETADLYEGIVDLNLRAYVCPNGGNVGVSYKIFLDLDSDFLGETVISSFNPPPPGIVLANNFLNPNYSGGDTLWFDKRAVPTASKFAFALETQVTGDTVRAYVRWNMPNSPGQYLIPRFPEGKHAIQWTVIQDGVTRTCQYSFRVTDCAPPTLICGNNLTDDIGPDRILPVTAAQFIEFVGDNITSNEDLEISMRKAGEGSNFPTQGGQPIPALTLDCSSIGMGLLQIWARDQHGNTSNCTVAVTLSDDAFVCTELPKVCARTYWDTTLVIEQVETTISWEDTAANPYSYMLPPAEDGCNTLDSFPSFPFLITENNLTNPLNGVSTFDLLLISKHILSIQPLNAPWKVIAADANSSGSVTTGDVVVLRRLILGFIENFPGGNSWRFFTDNCQFPANPFEVTGCSIGYEFDPMPFWAYPPEIRFYGIKTGDVDNSAIVNSAQSSAVYRAARRLLIPDIRLQTGETADIPVTMENAGNWSGFQCSLPFDAAKMEISNVLSGEALNPAEFAFAQSTPGEIRISWFDTKPQVLLPQEPVFYLRVKALAPVLLNEALAGPGETRSGRMASEAYTAENEVQQLEFVFRNTATNVSASGVMPPLPNPFTAGVQIPLRIDQAQEVRIAIRDFEGKTLYNNHLKLQPGAHLIDIPATAFSQAGVYTWQVWMDGNVSQGKLVRLNQK